MDTQGDILKQTGLTIVGLLDRWPDLSGEARAAINRELRYADASLEQALAALARARELAGIEPEGTEP